MSVAECEYNIRIYRTGVAIMCSNGFEQLCFRILPFDDDFSRLFSTLGLMVSGEGISSLRETLNVIFSLLPCRICIELHRFEFSRDSITSALKSNPRIKIMSIDGDHQLLLDLDEFRDSIDDSISIIKFLKVNYSGKPLNIKEYSGPYIDNETVIPLLNPRKLSLKDFTEKRVKSVVIPKDAVDVSYENFENDIPIVGTDTVRYLRMIIHTDASIKGFTSLQHLHVRIRPSFVFQEKRANDHVVIPMSLDCFDCLGCLAVLQISDLNNPPLVASILKQAPRLEIYKGSVSGLSEDLIHVKGIVFMDTIEEVIPFLDISKYPELQYVGLGTVDGISHEMYPIFEEYIQTNKKLKYIEYFSESMLSMLSIHCGAPINVSCDETEKIEKINSMCKYIMKGTTLSGLCGFEEREKKILQNMINLYTPTPKQKDLRSLLLYNSKSGFDYE